MGSKRLSEPVVGVYTGFVRLNHDYLRGASPRKHFADIQIEALNLKARIKGLEGHKK